MIPIFLRNGDVYILLQDYEMAKIKRKSGCISVVSCSSAVSIKRISRIICALALIKNIEVRGSHFWEGVLLE